MNLTDSITRERAAVTTGLYGTSELDWANVTTTDYLAEVHSPTSTEEVANAQRVNAEYIVMVYPTADITPVDRIVWKGDRYEVATGVAKWSMHGWVRGQSFMVRRVTGG